MPRVAPRICSKTEGPGPPTPTTPRRALQHARKRRPRFAEWFSGRVRARWPRGAAGSDRRCRRTPRSTSSRLFGSRPDRPRRALRSDRREGPVRRSGILPPAPIGFRSRRRISRRSLSEPIRLSRFDPLAAKTFVLERGATLTIRGTGKTPGVGPECGPFAMAYLEADGTSAVVDGLPRGDFRRPVVDHGLLRRGRRGP